MSSPIIPQRATRPVGGGEQPRDRNLVAELSLVVPTPPVRGNHSWPWTFSPTLDTPGLQRASAELESGVGRV